MQSRLFKIDEKESDVQRQIIELLKRNKFLTIRFNSGAIQDGKRFVWFYRICNNNRCSGLPDLAFMRNGKIYFCEVKATNGRLSDNQEKFIELAKSYGIDVTVADSWEQVADYIQTLEN